MQGHWLTAEASALTSTLRFTRWWPAELLQALTPPSRLLGVRAEHLFCIHEEVREQLAVDCSVQDAEQEISGGQVEPLPACAVAVLDVDRIYAPVVVGVDPPEGPSSRNKALEC